MLFRKEDSLAMLKFQEQKMQQILDVIYFNTYKYTPSEAVDTKKYELARLMNNYAVLFSDHQKMLEDYEEIKRKT